MSKDFSYSRNTTRIQNWNYNWKGLYFVTANTRIGEHYFGEIYNNQMYLNEIGLQVEKQWLNSPTIRPDMNLILDEFIVMPNHIHGIIGIGRNEFNYSPEQTDAMHCVPTAERITTQNSFGPQRKNLSSVMRGFKSSVTQWCRIQHKLFDWQPRFHDILISMKSH